MICGYEQEWCNFAEGMDPGAAADLALEAFADQVPHLPNLHERRAGVFAGNGARCYVDGYSRTNCHMETCTPEVDTPDAAVAAIKAIDRHLTEAISKPRRGVKLRLARTNIGESGVSWGTHDNFHCRHAPPAYTEFLVPFLATRPVYTGAGGLAPETLDFAVDARLLQFTQVTDRYRSECCRPIHGLRDEPLASFGHRIHILPGSTLCCETGIYLRAAATGLVLAAADLGRKPKPILELRDPVKALHATARDTSCQARLELSDGRRLTAVEIQHLYCDLVEKNLDHMEEPWAREAVERWRQVLRALERDPMTLCRTLDWPLKRSIFEKIKAAGSGLGPAQLRTRLQAFDLRFGMLGEGYFDAWERQGLIERVVSEEAILRAMHEPPPGTRAALRAKTIREFAAGHRRGSAWWTYILDLECDSRLDLGDPRTQQAEWNPPRPSPATAESEVREIPADCLR